MRRESRGRKKEKHVKEKEQCVGKEKEKETEKKIKQRSTFPFERISAIEAAMLGFSATINTVAWSPLDIAMAIIKEQ